MNTKPTVKKSLKTKKKSFQNIPLGIAYIKATFNNTIITITDSSAKKVIGWASCGSVKFLGSRKSSSFAASVAAKSAADMAVAAGMKEIEAVLDGGGNGREAAVKALQSKLQVTSIRDVTPVAYNGCRARKRRRV